jgi:hypothetical protein
MEPEMDAAEREGEPVERRREPGEAQEVWCQGAEAKVGGNIGSVVIALVLVMVMMGLVMGVVMGAWQTAGWGGTVGGMVVGGCVLSVVGLLGVIVLGGVFSRVVVRMEGTHLAVRKRPFGWKALWKCEAGKLAGVRVGVNVGNGLMGEEKATYAVVVRLEGGQHVWLAESKSLEDVRSVVWEVGDYYGLARKVDSLAGVPVGRWWVPRNQWKGEPDFSGVTPWSEEEVVKGAGKRGLVITRAGGTVILEAKKVWREASFWVLCAISAGIVPLTWWMARQSSQFLTQMLGGLTFLGCVTGLVWLVYLLSRPAKVVVNESGVRVHGRLWSPFYAAERIKTVDVRHPEELSDSAQRGLENGGSAKFAVRLSLLDDPLRVVTLDDGHTLMEHALGVARVVESGLGRGAKTGRDVEQPQGGVVSQREGETAETLRVEGGIVPLFSGKWIGLALVLIWFGLVWGCGFTTSTTRCKAGRSGG